MPYSARMFTIPGASPVSGTTVMFFALRLRVERLLLAHDLGIAAEIGEVHTGFDGEPRHVEVEVVRNRAHHRVAFAHHAEDRVLVAHVERRRKQATTRVWREKVGQMADLQISESNLFDFFVLQQIVGASRALKTGAENEHPHSKTSPK